MTKARRELAALMPSQDVLIEVLDARTPASSANPVIAELRGARPCIRILTRSDLADPALTSAWQRHLAAAPGVIAFAASTRDSAAIRRNVADALRRLGLVAAPGRSIRALIAGIPNVGKSTLINVLMDRTVAKVGDKPAVTTVQQRVVLPSGTVLTDSPGLMWPKIEDEQVGFRLALAGAIPDTALDHVVLARHGCELLGRRYPELLRRRFGLAELGATGDATLEAIGRRRGCLGAGGAIDLYKAAALVIHELRSGTIGRITLDEPPPAAAASSPSADEPPRSDEPPP